MIRIFPHNLNGSFLKYKKTRKYCGPEVLKFISAGRFTTIRKKLFYVLFKKNHS